MKYAIVSPTTKYYKNETHYKDKEISYTQPILTSNSTRVDEGDIIATSSFDCSTEWSGTAIYKIMGGAISTTTDVGYWQTTTTEVAWVQIKFPYNIHITGLSICTRPHDNYNGVVTAYTNSSKTTQIGISITTNAPVTTYTFLSNENAVKTDTIYLEISSGHSQYYGLQNLQIQGYRIIQEPYTYVEEVSSTDDYDFTKEVLMPYVIVSSTTKEVRRHYVITKEMEVD